MAIVRCDHHQPNNDRAKEPYLGAVNGFGLSHSGLVCGSLRCDETGLIWLTKSEIEAFERGTRTFSVSTGKLKIRAADGSVRSN